VSIDKDHFAVDLIEKVGPGGSFLKEPHTTRNMRKELFLPNQEKARVYEQYRLSADQREAVRAAKDRAKKILASHVPQMIDSDAKKQVDAILKEHGGKALT
jgi:trimethylamine--corrinoid protein Co-methyltransferase